MPTAQIRGLLDLWNEAAASEDPARIANLYAKDGVLLPTLAPVGASLSPCPTFRVLMMKTSSREEVEGFS